MLSELVEQLARNLKSFYWFLLKAPLLEEFKLPLKLSLIRHVVNKCRISRIYIFRLGVTITAFVISGTHLNE